LEWRAPTAKESEEVMRRNVRVATFTAAILLGIGFGGYAQQTRQAEGGARGGRQARFIAEDHRPPLFFRGDWKAGNPPKGENNVPVTQDLVTDPNLTLQLYGPGGKDVQISHHESPKDDPTYIWTGLCEGNWIVTLKDKTRYVDLSGPVAKIRWRVKEAGFHLLRPVVKLADGTMLAGDHTDGYSVDWYETEFPIANMRWRKLDPGKAVEATDGKWVYNPDLSKVDEVGFTDLSAGSGHGPGGSTRLDWIEVYGDPLPRNSAMQTGQNR
jgi:hypothetical protein